MNISIKDSSTQNKISSIEIDGKTLGTIKETAAGVIYINFDPKVWSNWDLYELVVTPNGGITIKLFTRLAHSGERTVYTPGTVYTPTAPEGKEPSVPLVFDPKSGMYLPQKITYDQYREIEEMRAKGMAERKTQTFKCECGGVMTFSIPPGKPFIKCPGCGKEYVLIRPGNEPEPLTWFPDGVPPVGPR